MSFVNSINRASFDAIASEYCRLFDLPLLLVDTAGGILEERMDEPFRPQFTLPDRYEGVMRSWRTVTVENACQWGDAYFTTTPLGMIAFAVPVMEGNIQAGALISGFVILPEMEADIRSELGRVLSHQGEEYEGLAEGIPVRTVSKQQIRRFADTLMAIVNRQGLLNRTALDEKREKTAQQLNIAHYIEYMQKTGTNVAGRIIDTQEEIVLRAKRGDITGAKELLNEYLGCIFFDTGMNFDTIKIRVIELIVLVSRGAIELGAGSRELLLLNQRYLAELNRAADYESLCHSVAKILEHFVGKISTIMIDRKKIKVKLMLEYIGRNFTDRIAAADVAAEAGLSVGRALHLLAGETGRSLSEHVTRCRIDYGKYLLLNTEDSIADIALQAGFYDNSQFTRTFRAQEGITPCQYRKRAGGSTAAI
ncbi:MAG: helix-turn-helix domain-containing protein [Spirochaetes bacterium]|nr:helix-turn-helix domain-containing protein [Spirochaetota bacterium]